MGRQQTAAQLLRRQKLVEARERYYRDKVPVILTTVRKRSIRKAAYNSYSITKAAASQILSVPVSEAALIFFCGDAEPANMLKLGLRPISGITDTVVAAPLGFHPAQVSAMVGAVTPSASNSPWNTRVIKYSAATTGTAQAHYVAPICSDTTSTYDEVDAKATQLYTSLVAANKLGELDYARFYLKPERFTVSKN